MQLYFIRHGQSVNNALWDSTGSGDNRFEDPDLTELGQQQAQLLGEYLATADPVSKIRGYDSDPEVGFGITHLYSSLVVRALQTGIAVSKALKIKLVAWEDLHETGGIYLDDVETGLPVGLPGKTRTFFEKHFPEVVLSDSINPEGWWNRPFEPAEARDERAQRTLEELLERHGGTDDRVAFVSHAGFYNHFLSALLKMDRMNTHTWFTLNNTGFTRIDFHKDYRELVYSNRVSHLPRQMLS